jgi:hypothetical protein
MTTASWPVARNIHVNWWLWPGSRGIRSEMLGVVAHNPLLGIMIADLQEALLRHSLIRPRLLPGGDYIGCAGSTATVTAKDADAKTPPYLTSTTKGTDTKTPASAASTSMSGSDSGTDKQADSESWWNDWEFFMPEMDPRAEAPAQPFTLLRHSSCRTKSDPVMMVFILHRSHGKLAPPPSTPVSSSTTTAADTVLQFEVRSQSTRGVSRHGRPTKAVEPVIKSTPALKNPFDIAAWMRRRHRRCRPTSDSDSHDSGFVASPRRTLLFPSPLPLLTLPPPRPKGRSIGSPCKSRLCTESNVSV